MIISQQQRGPWCVSKIETPKDRQSGSGKQRDPGEQEPKAWKSTCDVINCRGISMICLTSVFFKVFWGTKTVSQIPPTVSQNIVTWGHFNGERSLKFLQAVS